MGLPLGKNDSGKGFCEYHFNREVLLNTSMGSSDAESLEGKQDGSYEKQNLNWVESAEGGLKKICCRMLSYSGGAGVHDRKGWSLSFFQAFVGCLLHTDMIWDTNGGRKYGPCPPGLIT